MSEKKAILRHLFRIDLFFLLVYGLNRYDAIHPWIFDRCKEVEESPNNHLDLWSRGHFKSSIITFAKTIQDILASHGDDPLPFWRGNEVTVGIFSCTRPIAKQFLAQIKREFETNDLLRFAFPDILWQLPHKEAPSWSLDSGIIVKRRSNPKEGTVESWGLIDSQPTSKHFLLRVYDDVVTIDYVRSPEMIEKTTQAWEMSLNLGTPDGYERYIGTRYHFNDTYKTIMDRKAATPRIRPATVNGEVAGEPVLLTHEELDKKRRFMGPYVYASQMLCNPVADSTQSFKRDWLRYHENESWHGMNVYITVDPASSKKKGSDYTVMAVTGLGPDDNYYLIDMIRDRLSLTERAAALFRFHRKYKPRAVGYEQYGMQADIEHVKEEMKRQNYRFDITELGGRISKLDRIRRLQPIFEQHRYYLPATLHKTNYEGKTEDLVDVFLNSEYDAFPVSVHDDMLDCMSRLLDDTLSLVWPKITEDRPRDGYKDSYHKQRSRNSAWSA